MTYISEEMHEYYKDIKEKTVTAKSARNRKPHGGKAGPVVFPSDYYTEDQLQAMNGKVKTYRLNRSMNFDELKSMPEDLQRIYIKDLRKKFNVPDEELASVFEIEYERFADYIHGLGLPLSKIDMDEWQESDDFVRFFTWWVTMEDSND